MGDGDYLMALELQREFEREMELPEDVKVKAKNESNEKWKHRQTNADLNSTQNLVHPAWETLDPTPDVHSLFSAFDNKFFQGRLKCVTLEWSKRMYSCAGICYSNRNRFGMAVTIRLSEPLLKLRSRKDLVETLLHEMIHAYCSVLGIREGNGGHGPNFKKIMHGINKVAGTNITVYHSFHDEVDVYKTHWWRCNGICQHRKPFFGYVKRTSNRAPGPNDIWWKQHLESCGGTFLKIREPEKKKAKSEKENNPKAASSSKDIRTFFGNENKNSNKPKGFVKSNGGGTIVINDDGNTRTAEKPWTSTPKKTGFQTGTNKVVGFKDLTGTQGTPSVQQRPTIDLSKTGYSLTSSSTSTTLDSAAPNKVDRDHLRNVWANRFPSNSSKRPNEDKDDKSVDNDESEEKRRKLDTERGKEEETLDNLIEINESWTEIDDEVMLKVDHQDVIDISSDEDDNAVPLVEVSAPISTKLEKQTSEERQKLIKQEILDSSDCMLSEDDIELLDDDYNDDIVTASAELADTSLIDDLFGEDTLLSDFKKQNAVVASNSRYHSDPKNDIISCPICQDKVVRQFFSDHLEGCSGISTKIVAPKSKAKAPASKRKNESRSNNLSPNSVKRALQEAGYEENEFANILEMDESPPRGNEGQNRRRPLDTSTHACPVCGREVDVDRINEHLDICLPGR